MNEKKKRMRKMLDKKVWAVVGATPNAEKTGNGIYHTLVKHDYEVYAVNPNYSKMNDGSRCYPALKDLPKTPECIDFVVPPMVSKQILEEIDPQQYPYIWMEWGAYDDETIDYAQNKGFQVISGGTCVMNEINVRATAD